MSSEELATEKANRDASRNEMMGDLDGKEKNGGEHYVADEEVFDDPNMDHSQGPVSLGTHLLIVWNLSF